MPWSVVKGGGTCSSNEWAVINDDSGATEGCHPTKAKAEAQQRALYANEPDAGEASMWSIRQNGEEWEVVGPNGQVLSTRSTYDAALAVIAEQLRGTLAQGDGLLAERWTSGSGAIAFATETGDGRNFTDVTWTSRDPNVSLLPLMLQTETEMGHFGAQLAGYIEEVTGLGHGSNPGASGRFYDTEYGRQARDLLLDGRRFGVSLDPGAVEAEMSCVEEDEDGWCLAVRVDFQSYEIIGLTMTPFPAFAEASIGLEGAETLSLDGDLAKHGNSTATHSHEHSAFGSQGDDATHTHSHSHSNDASHNHHQVVTASAIPAAPPLAWFEMPEPQPGQRGMVDVYGMPVEELLVEQTWGGLAVPLTILDDGRVFGHIAGRGACHVGYMDRCVTPPESETGYAHFHVGEVVCEGGERVATGALVAGCDHAAISLRAPDARDHYAHNGVAWADVRATEGNWGAWACGVLRPDVTPEQVRVLRASGLSGDWRRIGGALELITALAVNAPGFPIERHAILASGFPEESLPSVSTRVATVSGEAMALTASSIVSRCHECQRRAAEAAGGMMPPLALALDARALRPLTEALASLERQVAVIERRTRHLRAAEVEALTARIRRSNGASA